MEVDSEARLCATAFGEQAENAERNMGNARAVAEEMEVIPSSSIHIN